MLVQIALRAGESSSVQNGIAGVVRVAMRKALGGDADRAFVQVIVGSRETEDAQRYQGDRIRIAILILAADKFGARAKRELFGKIADLSTRELDVRRDEVVTGIVETPSENWSNGYDERQWLRYMSYQLP